ncbi:LysR family transcriptional regulator [Paraburkholderia humisilvae]|uniref:HTH-type transcriptional regulator YhaJ n=1 Tax=Paraburkholderia humisilvae TaxID=627669 RepID=A0A6J5D8K6_9BURK|nr:LysR family transcriptional regulator [Paraburkholderia humisilvae]CAB3749076.1 HTH-type transcriptional regulator YhaJ [Paraburkholderia humisilvae]
MSDFTLRDMQCFDAVVRTGGFQAAAAALHRSHPAVFAAVARLESQTGLVLLDRSGYRVKLSDRGRSFHERMQLLLREAEGLRQHATQLAGGDESDLNVVLGDLCPRPATLELLARFFVGYPHTRLNLHFETVGGPMERLKTGEADLILHRVDMTDSSLEWITLGKVRLIPVAAPRMLPTPLPKTLRAEHLRNYAQCVMRDSARTPSDAHFLVMEGSRQITVPDQVMKKDVILQALAWGHLPDFLIEEELRSGALKSLAGRWLPGHTETVVAARRRNGPAGPVAQRLWTYLQANAPLI